jgi:hypothetical protein
MKGESRNGLLARLRRSRVPLGRAVLALFTTTWLGLAVQPCMAEAAQGGEIATVAEADAHAGGCGGASAPVEAPQDHDCPHCPPSGDCGTALECDAVGVPAMVGKALELPRADLGAWIDLPEPLPIADWRPVRGWTAAGPQDPRASPRSLRQRFCTYLK